MVRLLLPLGIMVLALVLSGMAFAQDEDEAWNEITNLMNSLTAANQQLGRAGAQWTPGTQWLPGMQLAPGTQWAPGTAGLQGTMKLSPADAQALAEFARWCQIYAQALQSIEAFGEDAVSNGGTQWWYRPNPRRPGLPAQQYNGMQTITPDMLRAYQEGMQFAGE